MDALQVFLQTVVELSDEFGQYEDGTWYDVVPNDPEELGQSRSAIGVMVKIAGEPGSYEVVASTTYNR